MGGSGYFLVKIVWIEMCSWVCTANIEMDQIVDGKETKKRGIPRKGKHFTTK